MRLASILAGIAFAGVTGAAFAQDEVVNVYNWSDYIDESILEDFTKETGIEVRYDVFDSNELLETKMLAGGSGYDVVVPTGTFLSRQIEAGAFAKLDADKLENAGNAWDAIKERTAKYDPDNAYSINYMWGTTGIGYNVGKVTEILGEDAPVDSLALIFDPANAEKLAECGIHVLDAPTEILPAALTYIGEDPDSKDTDVIAKTEAVLMAVRPHIQKFHSSEYINALANGDICVAFGWSGDILQARDRAAEADNGVEVAYSIPKEGALMWFDQMAIPTDAPNPENAHTFIDFILRPEVMAKASNYVYYANGNKPSQEFLNEDVIGDTAIYPDEDTLDNLYTVTAYPPKVNRIVTRLWTKVKTGQ
jgi:putrescine transport system substrate-binding protein